MNERISIYIGTTPTIELQLNIALDAIESLIISFKQGSKLAIEKNMSACKKNGNVLSLTLSQEDTLKFKPGRIQAQVKVKTKGNNVLASPVYVMDAKGVINTEVM